MFRFDAPELYIVRVSVYYGAPEKARRLNPDEGPILKAHLRLETAENRNLRLTLRRVSFVY